MDQVIIKFTILFLWFLRTVKATLFHTYLWQLKEYRLDRFWEHLKSKKNQGELFTIPFLLRILAFPLLLAPGLPVFPLVIIYLLEIVQGIFQFKNKRLKKPIFTAKAKLIVLGTLFLQVGVLLLVFLKIQFFPPMSPSPFFPVIESYYSPLYREYWFLLVSLPLLLTFLLPFAVSLIVLLLKLPTLLVKKRIYKQAQTKIQQLKDLKIIGITGSYGKTSTKEFLYTILLQKFNVLKTGQHCNTEIGVAQTVLKKLKKNHEIFIVEMGAYKRGEIKTICNIVKPQIGILTGINEQHLSLFGSLENIKKGKYELIESLPEDGVAVFNGDNEHCVELAKKTNIEQIIYSTERKADIYASKIEVKPEKISFMLHANNKSQKIEANLLGRQNISNLLAAISVAIELGMSLREIAKAVKKIEPLPKTMKLIEGKKGIKIVDDSYNANPDGVIAALDYLKSFPENLKKVIVMPSMLELGSATKEAHKKVSKKIGEVCDYAVFLDKDNLKAFEEGISGGAKIIAENDYRKILELIDKEIGNDSVILFESRGAERVINKLINP